MNPCGYSGFRNGVRVVAGVTIVGDLSLFAWQMLRWMFTRFPCRGTMLSTFYQVGALSLPVIALTGTFIGMVLAVQRLCAVSCNWS